MITSHIWASTVDDSTSTAGVFSSSTHSNPGCKGEKRREGRRHRWAPVDVRSDGEITSCREEMLLVPRGSFWQTCSTAVKIIKVCSPLFIFSAVKAPIGSWALTAPRITHVKGIRAQTTGVKRGSRSNGGQALQQEHRCLTTTETFSGAGFLLLFKVPHQPLLRNEAILSDKRPLLEENIEAKRPG